MYRSLCLALISAYIKSTCVCSYKLWKVCFYGQIILTILHFSFMLVFLSLFMHAYLFHHCPFISVFQSLSMRVCVFIQTCVPLCLIVVHACVCVRCIGVEPGASCTGAWAGGRLSPARLHARHNRSTRQNEDWRQAAAEVSEPAAAAARRRFDT